MIRRPPRSTLFPSRRSSDLDFGMPNMGGPIATDGELVFVSAAMDSYLRAFDIETGRELWKRSEEHTSELQSQSNLVCRLLLEKSTNIIHALADPDLWSTRLA